MKRDCTRFMSFLVCALLSVSAFSILNLQMDIGFVAKAESAEGGNTTESLSQDFKLVEKNPFHEAIEFSLWEASKAVDAKENVDTSLPPLQALAKKFEQLVATEGVHYIEASEMMGFEFKVEYWLKAGKFKKVELDSGKVTSFDGQDYVVYHLDEEEGTRFSSTDQFVAADIKVVSNGMLSMLAFSPYQQEEDQLLDEYECNVFYMDMEFMDYNGNWLFIDKNTGMLLQNQYGSGKESMITKTIEFDVGGFGDEVFMVPEGIKITDG